MQRNQKILVTTIWALAVVAMLGIVGTGLWARRTEASPVLFDAPKFSLTDQNGKTITDATMRGNVWVAMVFFTQCPGVCPMMTARMAQLQKAVTRPDVKIVSLSLDPEHDTPETMRAYAERFDTDQTRWHMLTGPQKTIYELAHAFKLAAKPAHDGEPILHTQKVLLIDRDNHVRGIYDTNEDDSMKQLAEDAQALAEAGEQFVSGGKELFAAINATLNGTSAILLIAAYLMIRRKLVRAHATLMIAALATSAIFLGFYLYSQFAFGERSSGLESGTLKTLYLILLASHVLLAIGMLPPIAITVWRAYTRQWLSHKKIARPTFWVWLYVSGTGVIVYWLLYHLFPSMARGG